MGNTVLEGAPPHQFRRESMQLCLQYVSLDGCWRSGSKEEAYREAHQGDRAAEEGALRETYVTWIERGGRHYCRATVKPESTISR